MEGGNDQSVAPRSSTAGLLVETAAITTPKSSDTIEVLDTATCTSNISLKPMMCQGPSSGSNADNVTATSSATCSFHFNRRGTNTSAIADTSASSRITADSILEAKLALANKHSSNRVPTRTVVVAADTAAHSAITAAKAAFGAAQQETKLQARPPVTVSRQLLPYTLEEWRMPAMTTLQMDVTSSTMSTSSTTSTLSVATLVPLDDQSIKASPRAVHLEVAPVQILQLAIPVKVVPNPATVKMFVGSIVRPMLVLVMFALVVVSVSLAVWIRHPQANAPTTSDATAARSYVGSGSTDEVGSVFIRRAFDLTEELYDAVDAYQRWQTTKQKASFETETMVTNNDTMVRLQDYGYPIGSWNVSLLTNFLASLIPIVKRRYCPS